MKPDDMGHVWEERKFSRMTLTCCKYCGIIKRQDGIKNKPCVGRVRVVLK